MASTNPIPQGLHSVTPNLVIRDCAKAIAFYERALDAKELRRMPSPDGKSIWHAELRIGDSTFFLNDEMPGMGQAAPTTERPAPTTMWIYVEDCDRAYRRAVDAGAKSIAEPADMFWGDRCCGVADPYGYTWSFATHQKDVSEEEMRRGGEAFAQEMKAHAIEAQAD